MLNLRTAAEQSFQRTMEKFQVIESHSLAMMRLIQAANDPKEGLKNRALRLSEAILGFVYERMQNVPKPAPAAYPAVLFSGFAGIPGIGETLAYASDTVKMYEGMFGKQVRQTREEFSKLRIARQHLEPLYSEPLALADIRLIAECLGTLAEAL